MIEQPDTGGYSDPYDAINAFEEYTGALKDRIDKLEAALSIMDGNAFPTNEQLAEVDRVLNGEHGPHGPECVICYQTPSPKQHALGDS